MDDWISAFVGAFLGFLAVSYLLSGGFFDD